MIRNGNDPLNKEPAPGLVEEASTSMSTMSQSERSIPSYRESVREKLRQQEAKINALMKNSQRDNSESIMMRMLKNLENDLKKTEAEKEELVAQLESRNNNNSSKSQDPPRVVESTNKNHHDRSSDDQDIIQSKELLSEAREQLREFQSRYNEWKTKYNECSAELVRKGRQVDVLRERLEEKNVQIVNLQVDLESHDIHFTNYSEEQFQLGREALEDLGMATKSKDGETRKTAKRAKKLISKLLSDLENLESRYKEEKLEHGRSKMVAENEINELKSVLRKFETTGGGGGGSNSNSPTKMAEGTTTTTTILSVEKESPTDEEANRSEGKSGNENEILLRNEIDRLQYRVLEMKTTMKEMEYLSEFDSFRSQAEKEKIETEIERMEMENMALQERIEILEAEDHPESDEMKNAYEDVQKRIETSFESISKLQMSKVTIQCQNEALRKELIDFKAAFLSQEDFSALLGATKADTDTHQDEVGSTEKEVKIGRRTLVPKEAPSLVADLQAQVQELRAELGRKEKEIMIEKSRATAEKEKLYARIKEHDDEDDSQSV